MRPPNRVVNEAFAEEKASLKALPCAPYRAVLRLERRASHEGMVSVGGNLYSVPDTTRRRIFDVHVLADADPHLRRRRRSSQSTPLWKGAARSGSILRIASPSARARRGKANEPSVLTRAGDRVVRRPLDFYAAVGRRLAGLGGVR